MKKSTLFSLFQIIILFLNSSKMIKKLVLVLFVLFINKISFSQNWIYVGSSVMGDRYYLRNTSSNEYGNKKVWLKKEAEKLTYTKNRKTYTLINGYCLQLNEYDCTEKKSKLLSMAYYNSKGIVVSSYQFEEFDTDWNFVVPESVGEMLLDKVCELF